jgi:2-C-methyl-D-erythritol 2,4-cyclodiphosphate synthase
MIIRSGIGYDIHRFTKKRDLWLGGVKIPSDFGLEGHSDADVLIHAIADALLGAAALGDIGQHFPNTDPEWKNVRSIVLLEKIHQMLIRQSCRIVNIDATLIMEKPKISGYTKLMCETLSVLLDIEVSQINIKATTNETLGALGRSEGAAAIAIATLQYS